MLKPRSHHAVMNALRYRPLAPPLLACPHCWLAALLPLLTSCRHRAEHRSGDAAAVQRLLVRHAQPSRPGPLSEPRAC